MSRTLQTSLIVTLLALVTFWWGTDGLRAFTAEGARRERVLRNPALLPPIALEDQDGHRFSFDAFRNRLLAVEFIYTRCETICRSLGTAFRQIRDTVPTERLGTEFALLTISFDPRDDVAALKRYARAHGADGIHWRVARPAREADIPALLYRFGVVAIPDGFGGFEHNAAIHVVDQKGRLVSIRDIEAPRKFVLAAGLAP